MAEIVVDRLESIQVQQEQRDIAPVPLKRVERALDFLFEAHAIGESSQRIAADELGELILGDKSAEDRAGAVPAGFRVGVEVKHGEKCEHHRQRVFPDDRASYQRDQDDHTRGDGYPGAACHASGRLPAANSDRNS